jgi:ubiquinone/menaquinone biosynthesis C-methylase UbiE
MNAQKYARSLRLEWYWLGLGSNSELRAMDASMIGTERLTQDEYSELKTVSHAEADELIMKAFKIDKHRARLMANYFDDMRTCFKDFFRVIKPGGYFVLVVGNNRVFAQRIPNHRILGDLAAREGFKLACSFVDKIKSRGLMTKRNTTADIIPDEWVLVLKK